VLGTPTRQRWNNIEMMPEFKTWWPHLRLDGWVWRTVHVLHR